MCHGKLTQEVQHNLALALPSALPLALALPCLWSRLGLALPLPCLWPVLALPVACSGLAFIALDLALPLQCFAFAMLLNFLI